MAASRTASTCLRTGPASRCWRCWSYLATWAVMLGLHGEPPIWLTNMVFVAGTVVPAIAAASIALEATLALGEELQRSLTLSAQLDDLVTERPEDGLQGYQRLAKEAIRLQRAQEDRWAEGWVRPGWCGPAERASQAATTAA